MEGRMRPSELHGLIRKELRGSIAGDASSAVDDEASLPSSVRLAFATWRERLRGTGGDLGQLVAPSGSLEWMAPVTPPELRPSGI
jgi:hypothetical protein